MTTFSAKLPSMVFFFLSNRKKRILKMIMMTIYVQDSVIYYTARNAKAVLFGTGPRVASVVISLYLSTVRALNASLGVSILE